MRRFATPLLVVLVPSVAPAQRVEIGILGGWYQPTPSTHSQHFMYPVVAEFVRGGSGSLGWHFGVAGRRFGVTASVLHTWPTASSMTLVDNTGAEHQLTPLEFTSTFFMLQPYVRFPISKTLEANFAVGPSFTDTDGRGEGAEGDYDNIDEWWGVALSVALRAHVGPRAAVELRGSNMNRLEGEEDRSLFEVMAGGTHWIVGVGVAWALKRE